MSDANIKHLRDNGICVVIASDPAKVRFIDPIPSQSSRTEIENAAIQLSRRILNGQVFNDDGTRICTKKFCELLLAGTPLRSGPSPEEYNKQVYDGAKHDELRKLAREEAKAEREALKAKQQPKP